MGRRKKRVVDNSKNEPPKSLRVQLKQNYSQKMDIEKNRKKYERPEISVMKDYIIKNYRKATQKLKRAMSKHYYSASDVLQNANAQFHMIYRKNFDSEYTYSGAYDGRIMAKMLRDVKEQGLRWMSANDLATFYHAIDNIMSVDARKASREYAKAQEEFRKQNMDFLSQFRRLQKMSIDFHEIFAFLSYDDVAHFMEEGKTDVEIYEKYVEETNKKWSTLDDEEKYYKSRLNAKFAEKLDNRVLERLVNKGLDY